MCFSQRKRRVRKRVLLQVLMWGVEMVWVVEMIQGTLLGGLMEGKEGVGVGCCGVYHREQGRWSWRWSYMLLCRYDVCINTSVWVKMSVWVYE